MKVIPPISKYMSGMPHTIGKGVSIVKALSMMSEMNIRHLPVLDGGRLVGILSDRDVKLASSFADAEKLNVEDVMIPDPYRVRPDASLELVVGEMAERKYGCAIIEQENHRVVGIFTATDSLRVLAEILEKNYRHS